MKEKTGQCPKDQVIINPGDSREPITGEYKLALAIVMEEAARRLEIATSRSNVNLAGGRATKVEEGSTYLRVYTEDPEEDNRFWDEVRKIKKEISESPTLR